MTISTPIWDEHPWQALPSLQNDITADACVVGLGGSGLSALKLLNEAGLSVVGIDAGSVAGKAAGANGGFLLAGSAHFYHRAVQEQGRNKARDIYQATIGEIQRMSQETPEAIRLTGSLRIATSADEFADCQAQIKAMRKDELPVEPYEGPEGEGLLFPTDGVFNPKLRCQLMARDLLARGASLFEHTKALSVMPGSVRTATATITCRDVIVAVDGGLESIFPQLQGRVRTARLQMLATAPTHEVSFNRPVYARYGMEYWQQLPDGRIALGGFRDAGGDDEWVNSNEPTLAVQTSLEHFLRETLNVAAAITHRWAAPVGFTQGGIPIMEALDRGLWVMGGYSGTGNVIGSLCGRNIAQTIIESS